MDGETMIEIGRDGVSDPARDKGVATGYDKAFRLLGGRHTVWIACDDGVVRACMPVEADIADEVALSLRGVTGMYGVHALSPNVIACRGEMRVTATEGSRLVSCVWDEGDGGRISWPCHAMLEMADLVWREGACSRT